MVKIISSKPSTLMMLESPQYPAEQRPYIGMSQLGHSCARYLWYSFRWAYIETFPARMMRLFDRGHREEECMVKQLESIGIKCHSFQEEFVAGWGHIKGHCDGMADDVPEAPKTTHLLEFKTMSDKYFKQTQKEGVQLAKPVYYIQCQIGMKFFKLKRTLFMAVNKNDDSYYIERIRYDSNAANIAVKRGEGIILSETPPPKTFKPTWWECKFCAARNICHYNDPFNITCRTCVNVSVEKEGRFKCGLYEKDLTKKEQLEACPAYVPVLN